MKAESVLIIFNMIRNTMVVGSELKALMKRVEAGEDISNEELTSANKEQLSLTESLKDL